MWPDFVNLILSYYNFPGWKLQVLRFCGCEVLIVLEAPEKTDTAQTYHIEF